MQSLLSKLGSLVLGGSADQSPSSTQPEPATEPVALESLITGDLVASGAGRLDRVKPDGQLETVHANVFAAVSRTSPFTYSLHICDSSKLLLAQPVSNDMQMQYNKANRSLSWIMLLSDTVCAWEFVFSDVQEEHAVKMHLSLALVETGRQESFEKIIADKDRNWVHQATEMDDAVSDYKETERDRMCFTGDLLAAREPVFPVEVSDSSDDEQPQTPPRQQREGHEDDDEEEPVYQRSALRITRGGTPYQRKIGTTPARKNRNSTMDVG